MAKMVALVLLRLFAAASASSCSSSHDQEALMAILEGPAEGWLPSAAVRRLENVSSCEDWDLHQACSGAAGHVRSVRECRDLAEGEVVDLGSVDSLVGGYSVLGTCVCYERCACGARRLQGRTWGRTSTPAPTSQQNDDASLAGTIIGASLAAWLVLRFIFASLLYQALKEEKVLTDFPQSDSFSTSLLDVCADRYVCCFGCCFPCEMAAANAHRAGIRPFWIAWLRLLFCGSCTLPEIRSELRSLSGMKRSKWDLCLVQCCCWCTVCQEARHVEKADDIVNKRLGSTMQTQTPKVGFT